MLVIAELARTPAGPASEGTPKVSGLAETERIGDVVDRQLGVAQVLDGNLHPELVHQIAKRCALLVELAPQRPRRHVKACCDRLKGGRPHQVDQKDLADLAGNACAYLQFSQQRFTKLYDRRMSDLVAVLGLAVQIC